jgi:predicted nucleic acid-binding protein
MIVLDASVVVELLTGGAMAEPLRLDLAGRDDQFIVPHLLDIEVVSAIRSLAAGHRIDPHAVDQILNGLAALRAVRFPHTPLIGRIWELRHNFTAYDAAYIALAEATGSILYTCDEKLSRGHRARVALFSR